MLKLYHGTTSVCSAKVRLVLAEKQLAYESEVLDLQRGDQHRPAYLALNPNAVVPTLVDGNDVVIESTIIMEYLEDRFPEKPLMPPAPLERARVREWLKLVDEKLHVAAGPIMFATANRQVLLRKSPEELETHFAHIPDAAYRERQRNAVAQGLHSQAAQDALGLHDRIFARMDQALRDCEFLAGSGFTLADAALIPYLNRCALLGLGPVLTDGRKALSGWWSRMRERPSFAPAILDPMRPQDHARFDLDTSEIASTARELLAHDAARSAPTG